MTGGTVEGDIIAPFDAHNVNTSQPVGGDEALLTDEINQRIANTSERIQRLDDGTEK